MSDIQEIIKRRLGDVGDKVERRFNEVKAHQDKIQDQVDAIETASLRKTGSAKTLASELEKQLQRHESDFKAYASGKRQPIDIQVKATVADGLREDHLNRVGIESPNRTSHVRQFIPQTTTSNNTVIFGKETAYTDGSAGQVEGSIKGESDFTLSEESAPVVTRAAFIDVPIQMMDDVSFLRQYITSRLMGYLNEDEDDNLLYGDGTATNVTGVTVNADAFTGPTTTVKFDVIALAVNQLQAGNRNPTGILLHPDDYWAMALEKGSDDHYLHPSAVISGEQPLTFAGVPALPNTAVTPDDFIVGDFQGGAVIARRDNMNIRFSEENADNFTRNMVTIRAEHRFALPILADNAFIHDTFTAAGTA